MIENRGIGQIKIKEYMLPDEVFIAQTIKDGEERVDDFLDNMFFLKPGDVPTVEQELMVYKNLYNYPRVIPVAFDEVGEEMPNFVTVVGTPKKDQSEVPTPTLAEVEINADSGF